jgi:hypothetical protein
MQAKIASLLTTAPDRLAAYAAVQGGKPVGVVVLRGSLDGRDVLVMLSGQDAMELAAALIVATAAAAGVATPCVEVAPGAAPAEAGKA